MKSLITLLSILFSISIFAQEKMRVMTFNTTCSYLCEKGNYDSFKKRKYWIVDTIKRSKPDIISMQEILFSNQLKWIKRQLKDYNVYYYRKFFIFRFADPAIFVKKDRFHIYKHGGFWLGPRGYRFSLGWKTALPRRVHWVKLHDKTTQRDFFLASSHFDNRKKNKENSAKVFTHAFRNVTLPIIFAADTNLRPEMDGYKHLNQYFYDSFDIKQKFHMIKNTQTTIHDSCNLEKATVFPDCRVDHIFLSKNHSWIVKSWNVDQYKYGKDLKFTSDHRAIYADIILK